MVSEAQVKTIAVIPTINTLGLTASLVEHLLNCDNVDEVHLYDSGADDTRAWAMHRQLLDRRLKWFDAIDIDIHNVWNKAILESSNEPTNVAILNSDIRLPINAISTMAQLMRENEYQLACVDPTLPALYSQHFARWNPELSNMISPIDPVAVPSGPEFVVGWAFMVAAEFWNGEPYAVYPDFQWWYGDDDIFLRTKHRGGRICRIAGLGSDHIGSISDPHNPNKQEKIRADTELFGKVWNMERLN